ncbi:MAG: hypothetical protein JO022_07855 [Acidobacteriaceae bacterium]|nr:hypothetical protein [Acidobacteriaceae bacterium]
MRLGKWTAMRCPALLQSPSARPISSLWVDMVVSLRERLLGGVTYELTYYVKGLDISTIDPRHEHVFPKLIY